MPDLITVVGVVGSTPRHIVTNEKLAITNFRLASTHRKYDRSQQKYVDGETNWYTVVAFRQLASNLIGSVDKGQRVVVTGRLQLKDWDNGEKKGQELEIVADAVGHDLSWGTSVFTRTTVGSGAAEGDAEGDAHAPPGESDPDARAGSAPDSVEALAAELNADLESGVLLPDTAEGASVPF